MRIYKLLDEKGREIKSPSPVLGSVTFDAREGLSSIWSEDGQLELARMVKSRIAWITHKSMRIEGMEPFEINGETHYRAMEWQVWFETGDQV